MVVKETCNVSASANAAGASPTTTAHADNGLGDPEIPGGDNLSSASASSSGTRYKVVSPGLDGSVRLTCSASASASANAGYPRYSLTSGLNVSYWALVYPVRVGLAGTTQDANYADNILIGQGCSADLVAPLATLTNHQWTVPGETFASFNVDPFWEWGHADPVPASDWTSANPHWFWRKDEAVTVSCTAQASVNGVVIGNVTGERRVTVWAPYYIFKNTAGPVTVGDRGSGLELYAGGPGGGGFWQPPGMNFGGRVGTPDLFRYAGVGQWQFVQIIYPNRWMYKRDLAFGTLVPYPMNRNGAKALDVHYPYADPTTGLAGRNSPPPPWPADSVEQDPAPNTPTYWAEDSPGHSLSDDYERSRVDESFDDFMMYLPPDAGQGQHVDWVPLHLFQWKWQADVSRTGATWLGGWAPNPPGAVSDKSSQRWTVHPDWTQILRRGSAHF